MSYCEDHRDQAGKPIHLFTLDQCLVCGQTAERVFFRRAPPWEEWGGQWVNPDELARLREEAGITPWIARWELIQDATPRH